MKLISKKRLMGLALTLTVLGSTNTVFAASVSSQDQNNARIASSRLAPGIDRFNKDLTLNLSTNSNTVSILTNDINNAEGAITFATPYIGKVKDVEIQNSLKRLVTTLKDDEDKANAKIAAGILLPLIDRFNKDLTLNPSTNSNTVSILTNDINNAEGAITFATPYIGKVKDVEIQNSLKRLVTTLKDDEDKANAKIAAGILLPLIDRFNKDLTLNPSTNSNTVSILTNDINNAEGVITFATPYIGKVKDVGIQNSLKRLVTTLKDDEDKANAKIAAGILLPLIDRFNKDLTLNLSTNNNGVNILTNDVKKAEGAITFATPYIGKIKDVGIQNSLKRLVTTLKNDEGKANAKIAAGK